MKKTSTTLSLIARTALKTIPCIVLAVVGIVIVMVVFMAILFSDEDSTYSFDTLADARATDLDENGWIPAYLPDCVRDVKIRTSIDTSATRFTFTVPDGCR